MSENIRQEREFRRDDYVEQRRRMMQDWADRLDLCEQGRVEEARRHLVVHLPVLERPAMSECAQTFVRAA